MATEPPGSTYGGRTGPPGGAVTWLAGLIVLVALVAAATTVHGIRSSERQLADHFSTRSEIAAEFVAGWIEEEANGQQQLARRRFAGAVAPDEFSSVVSDLGYDAAVLLDHRGHALAVHPPAPERLGRPVSDGYAHLTGALRGEPTVSDVVASLVRRDSVVAVATPFEGRSGRRVFSPAFAVRNTSVDTFVRSSLPIPGGVVYLVDGTGRVVASGKSAIRPGGRLPGWLRSRLGGGSTRAGDARAGGEPVRYAWAPVGGSSWRVVMVVPTQALYAPVDPSRKLQWLLVAVLLFMASAVVVLLAKLRTAVDRLRGSEAQRGRLLLHAIGSAEAERTRIAADLHDGPIQGLAAAGFLLGAAAEELRSGASGAAASTVGAAESSLNDEIQCLRTIMSGLRPPALDERGVEAAITDLATEHVRDQGVGLEMDVVLTRPLEAPDDTLVYRIVQEALLNVRRHASAKAVRLSVSERHDVILLRIEDDGVGFEPVRNSELGGLGHAGIAIMRERVELSGGIWSLDSRPDQGTLIEACIPRTVGASASRDLAA